MNKFEKNTLLVAGIAGIVGIIVLAFGILFGGIAILRDGDTLEKISRTIPFIHFSEDTIEKIENYDSDDDADDEDEFDEDEFDEDEYDEDEFDEDELDEADAETLHGKACYSYNADDVNNMLIEINANEIKVQKSDDNQIVVKVSEKTPVKVGMDGDTVVVKSIDEKMTFGSRHRSIEILIPEGCEFDTLEWNLGAGALRSNKVKLNCQEFSLNVGAGEVSIKGITAEDVTMTVGAGSLSVKDAQIENAEMTVDMGQCNLDGDITGELNLSVNMGEADLTMTGNQNDHNYEISASAGEINVGKESVSGLGANRSIDNGADSTYNISCNMGAVNVKF